MSGSGVGVKTKVQRERESREREREAGAGASSTPSLVPPLPLSSATLNPLGEGRERERGAVGYAGRGTTPSPRAATSRSPRPTTPPRRLSTPVVPAQHSNSATPGVVSGSGRVERGRQRQGEAGQGGLFPDAGAPLVSPIPRGDYPVLGSRVKGEVERERGRQGGGTGFDQSGLITTDDGMSELSDMMMPSHLEGLGGLGGLGGEREGALLRGTPEMDSGSGLLVTPQADFMTESGTAFHGLPLLSPPRGSFDASSLSLSYSQAVRKRGHVAPNGVYHTPRLHTLQYMDTDTDTYMSMEGSSDGEEGGEREGGWDMEEEGGRERERVGSVRYSHMRIREITAQTVEREKREREEKERLKREREREKKKDKGRKKAKSPMTMVQNPLHRLSVSARSPEHSTKTLEAKTSVNKPQVTVGERGGGVSTPVAVEAAVEAPVKSDKREEEARQGERDKEGETLSAPATSMEDKDTDTPREASADPSVSQVNVHPSVSKLFGAPAETDTETERDAGGGRERDAEREREGRRPRPSHPLAVGQANVSLSEPSEVEREGEGGSPSLPRVTPREEGGSVATTPTRVESTYPPASTSPLRASGLNRDNSSPESVKGVEGESVKGVEGESVPDPLDPLESPTLTPVSVPASLHSSTHSTHSTRSTHSVHTVYDHVDTEILTALRSLQRTLRTRFCDSRSLSPHVPDDVSRSISHHPALTTPLCFPGEGQGERERERGEGEVEGVQSATANSLSFLSALPSLVHLVREREVAETRRQRERADRAEARCQRLLREVEELKASAPGHKGEGARETEGEREGGLFEDMHSTPPVSMVGVGTDTVSVSCQTPLTREQIVTEARDIAGTIRIDQLQRQVSSLKAYLVEASYELAGGGMG
ncbi:hypothetical protein KIPB_007480 [Kipferlia bialata]|uniref:Uncharacterized protein n=1 Tax=Kipferlia bialata TaxID=797122 RepID=A0A9K3CYV5_9EUKA|nr:hypothetical protein KIPB_007480 [Kipferlia bialata]|eukprot:g7480.t1